MLSPWYMLSNSKAILVKSGGVWTFTRSSSWTIFTQSNLMLDFTWLITQTIMLQEIKYHFQAVKNSRGLKEEGWLQNAYFFLRSRRFSTVFDLCSPISNLRSFTCFFFFFFFLFSSPLPSTISSTPSSFTIVASFPSSWARFYIYIFKKKTFMHNQKQKERDRQTDRERHLSVS